MSRITLSTIQGNTAANVVTLASGTTFSAPGLPVQTIWARTDAKSVYATSASGDGTTITDMNIAITPRYASSLLLITWMINGEMQYNNTFTAHMNGLMITTVGYQPYNINVGNFYYSGFAAGYYDQDENSTPSNYVIQYAVPAVNTTARTYAPAVRGGATFTLNRSIGSAGADAYETGISTGTIMEIAQ